MFNGKNQTLEDSFLNSALIRENHHIWEGYAKESEDTGILDYPYRPTYMTHEPDLDDNDLQINPDTWARYAVGIQYMGVSNKETTRSLGAWLQVLIELTDIKKALRPTEYSELLRFFATHQEALMDYLKHFSATIPEKVIEGLEEVTDKIPPDFFKLIAHRVKEAFSERKEGLLLNNISTEAPYGLELMFGRSLEAVHILPSIDKLEKIDLFSGIELELTKNTSVKARLVHPEDIEAIEHVGKMRAAGYKRFGAERYKQARAESLHPEKSFLILIEVSRRGPDGQMFTLPHSTITVEYSGDVEGERPLTEAFRLMTDKGILVRELWQFNAMKVGGIDISLKEFADGCIGEEGEECVEIHGVKERRSLEMLAKRLQIPIEELLGFSEIESLAFFEIGKDTWNKVFSGELSTSEAIPETPGADPTLFQYEYTLAILMAGEAMRRYGATSMGALLQPELRDKLGHPQVTGVDIPILENMVLNPFHKNKHIDENGTTYNIDYFIHFYPYFLKRFLSKNIGFNKALRKLSLEDRHILDDQMQNPELKKKFALELAQLIIKTEPAKIGPVMVKVDQAKYMADLAHSVNRRLEENRGVITTEFRPDKQFAEEA